MGKRRGGGAAAAAASSAPAPIAADGLLSMPVAFPGDSDRGGGAGAGMVAAEAPAPLSTEVLQLSTPVAFPGDSGGDAQTQGSAVPANPEQALSEPVDDGQAAISRRIAERDEQQAAENAAKEAKRLQKEEDKAAKAKAKAAKAEAKAAEKAAKKAEKGGGFFSRKGKGGAPDAATTASAEPADTFDYEAANRRAERRAAARAEQLELEQQAEVVASSSSLVRRARCADLAYHNQLLTLATFCGLVRSSTGQ